MKWILPLSLLITFELIADIFAKQWSLDRKVSLAVGALGCYMIVNTFWLFALKNGSGLARGAFGTLSLQRKFSQDPNYGSGIRFSFDRTFILE